MQLNLSGQNLRDSRYEELYVSNWNCPDRTCEIPGTSVHLFQTVRWLRSSTHSKSDCSIGLRDFASFVTEYSKPCSEFVICFRETRPCCSSSFKRRATVVEDESTSFFNSENRAGFFFRSKTINVCNDFDLVKSDNNSSTRP